MERRVAHGVGYGFVPSKIVRMKDFDRQNTTFGSCPDRPILNACRRSDASATCSMDIIAAHLVIWILKQLWSRIPMIWVVLWKKEIASDFVLGTLVWILPDT